MRHGISLMVKIMDRLNGWDSLDMTTAWLGQVWWAGQVGMYGGMGSIQVLA